MTYVFTCTCFDVKQNQSSNIILSQNHNSKYVVIGMTNKITVPIPIYYNTSLCIWSRCLLNHARSFYGYIVTVVIWI